MRKWQRYTDKREEQQGPDTARQAEEHRAQALALAATRGVQDGREYVVRKYVNGLPSSQPIFFVVPYYELDGVTVDVEMRSMGMLVREHAEWCAMRGLDETTFG